MKKITLLFFVLFAFGIYSCAENQLDSVESAELDTLNKNGNNGKNGNNNDLPFSSPGTFESITDDQEFCGEPVECPFIAGQNIDAGSVTVSNDEDYLYVKVYSKAGFQDVSENIKMWIGLTPPDRRPPSGKFPYKVTETGDMHIFKIELSTLPEWDECGNQYVIIVHGDVLTEEGNSGSGETAYGGCELTGDQPWWAYMDYTTQCCEEEEMELGWLYKAGSPWRVSCFEDENEIFGVSNQFPFGGSYLTGEKSFPIYSNIIEGCSTDNVVTVGMVTMLFLDSSDDENARIKLSFKMNEEYSANEWRLYIGWLNPILEEEFDANLLSSVQSIPVSGGTGEYIWYVKDWSGTRGDGGVDGNALDQFFISSRIMFTENN